jgi:accessory gene regulator protein AgrB
MHTVQYRNRKKNHESRKSLKKKKRIWLNRLLLMSINLVIFIYMEKTSNLVIGNFFNLDVDSVNVKPLQKDFLRSFVSQVT